MNPLTHLKRFNRRIETISQIHRSGLMDLTAVLQQLTGMRPKGAAEKIRKASSMRVRVIPPMLTWSTGWIGSSPFTSGYSPASPCSGCGPMSSGTPKASTTGAGSAFPAT
ncbi:hypothetical protein [Synechococcus sp. CBW1006]|uniref:hypothetical protein n=1 Tax=Synechococcus sp. CBW1006 TaxID=1353138 RepID=UPI001E544AFC|nr:hypothetical protein [Synechococcus sp. CBW1006]